MNDYLPWKTENYRACVLTALCFTTLGVSHAQPDKTDLSVADFTFRDGQVHSRHVSYIDGLYIAEHDMIMGADASSTVSGRKQTKGLSNSAYGRVWPNGVVPYRLNSNLSDSAREKVRDAVAHWNSFEAVTLIERTSANAGAYPDYIDFVYEDRCASWIGYKKDGAQSIYTGDKCSTGTLIHEIGHALGLLHEHTRSDRDQYVQIHWDRIQQDMEVNFEVMDGSILLGDYDYDSIMHYGEYFFSRNGLPTIEPTQQTSAVIGQRIETSQGDRDSIAQLYLSNLALSVNSASQSASGQPVELQLQATNVSQNGANTLSIQLPLQSDTRLLSYSSTAWSCVQSDAISQVTCTTPVLTAGASSSVTLSLSTGSRTGTMSFDATLDSRTHDSDLSDNSDSTAITLAATAGEPDAQDEAEPKIASALDSGGGSFDLSRLSMLLLLLGLVTCFRSQHTVVRHKLAAVTARR